VTIEIRACRDQDELKLYGDIVSYVFASTEGMDEELSSTQPDWTTCAFVDGKMATTLGAFPFTVRLNGAPVRMGGVTAVGTLPEFRRRGLLRQVMKQAFLSMHEREQHYAILWASLGAIYQRFGYGMAAPYIRYTFDPRFATFASPEPPSGSITMMPKGDAWPIVKQLYIRHATPRNLFIHRAAPLWEVGTLRPRKKGEPVYIAVYRDDDGEPQGYIVYRTFEGELAGPGPSQTMQVTDFVALTMGAYRQLWSYICAHDLVGKVEMGGVIGEDDPAPDLLLEPRILNKTSWDGIWMRVIDAERGLPQRPYAARGELTFEIPADDMCPWNTGTWLLETDGETTEVRRTGHAAQLTIPIATLAPLVSGHRPATHYLRMGRMDGDSEAAAIADRIFQAKYPPLCPNSF